MRADWKAQDISESEICGDDREALRFRASCKFVGPAPKTGVANVHRLEASGAKQRCKGPRQVFVNEKGRVYLTTRICSSETAWAA